MIHLRGIAVLMALVVAPPVLAQDIADRGPILAAPCASCHGPGGQSPGSIPSIDGLEAGQLADLLHAFKSGELEGTVMNRIARGYTDSEIEAIAAYIAAHYN